MKRFLIPVIVILILMALGLTIVLYNRANNSDKNQNEENNSEEINDDYIPLPNGEIIDLSDENSNISVSLSGTEFSVDSEISSLIQNNSTNEYKLFVNIEIDNQGSWMNVLNPQCRCNEECDLENNKISGNQRVSINFNLQEDNCFPIDNSLIKPGNYRLVVTTYQDNLIAGRVYKSFTIK